MRVSNHCYDDLQIQAMYICIHLGDRPSEGSSICTVTIDHELSRSAHVERNRSGNQHVDRDEIPCATQFPGSTRYNVYITSPAWRRLADRVLRAVIFITHHTRRPSERLILLSSIDNIDPGIDLIAITEPATSYNLIAKRSQPTDRIR